MGIFLIGTVSIAPILASSDNDKNDFGEGARELGGSGQMGEHASNQEEPRHGIGNVGQDAVCPNSDEKIHPSQLARILTGEEGCPE